jgi:hypothetical protein
MPRNPDGTYNLPEPPVLSGQTIEANWANNSFADFSQTFGDSLSRSGQGSMTAQFRGVDGTTGVPGMSFTNEANTGFHRPDAGDLYVSVLGQDYFRWTDDNGVQLSVDGVVWLDVTDSDDVAGLQVQITDNADAIIVNAGNIATNTANIIDLDTRVGFLEAANPLTVQWLEIAAQINQTSIVAGDVTPTAVIDTTTGNRWLLDNSAGGTLTIQKPVGARDIGPDYTVEGNIIVTNLGAGGPIVIAGAAAQDVIGSVSPVPNAKSVLSYILHNRSGTYEETYIWSIG